MRRSTSYSHARNPPHHGATLFKFATLSALPIRLRRLPPDDTDAFFAISSGSRGAQFSPSELHVRRPTAALSPSLPPPPPSPAASPPIFLFLFHFFFHFHRFSHTRRKNSLLRLSVSQERRCRRTRTLCLRTWAPCPLAPLHSGCSTAAVGREVSGVVPPL